MTTFENETPGEEVNEAFAGADESWNAVDPEDAPVVEEPEEEEQWGTEDDTYIVQKAFTLDGKTYEKGAVIPVRCQFCTMWERPLKALNDKALCRTGASFGIKTDSGEVTVKASIDKWSCQSYFLPLDLKDQIESLPTDYGTALTLQWLLKSAEAMMRVKERCTKWFERNDPDGDPEAAFDAALNMVLYYDTVDQVQKGKGFLKAYVDILRTRRKAKRPIQVGKFSRYDWVKWKLSDTVEVSGFIMSMGAGKITLMPEDLPNAQLIDVTAKAPFPIVYKYKEWKDNYQPVVTSKSAVVDLSTSDDDDDAAE